MINGKQKKHLLVVMLLFLMIGIIYLLAISYATNIIKVRSFLANLPSKNILLSVDVWEKNNGNINSLLLLIRKNGQQVYKSIYSYNGNKILALTTNQGSTALCILSQKYNTLRILGAEQEFSLDKHSVILVKIEQGRFVFSCVDLPKTTLGLIDVTKKIDAKELLSELTMQSSEVKRFLNTVEVTASSK